MCEVCGKVVSYTNPEQRVQEAIDDPGQFCEGHITRPNEAAIRTIMGVLRAHQNPDNAYFIRKADGQLMSHAYINRSDGSYFPSIPKGSYEIGVGKKQSSSYAILREHLEQAWIDAARQEVA